MAASLFLSLLNLTTQILAFIPQYFPSSYSSSSKPSLASKLTQEIAKLDRTLRMIQALLADAEEREIRDELVKLWLFELKLVAYKAEEVLEDFNYELQKRRSEANLPVNASVSHEDCENSRDKQLVSFSRLEESSFVEDLLDRIVIVKEELDDISNDKERLSLKEGDGSRWPVESHSSRGTSSLVNFFEIYGRENEKNQVINALLEPDRTSNPPDHNNSDMQTISILGMGGIGKTTLARLVYNDERVKNHFELMSWVWVSEVYDEVRLTKAIIESIKGESCNLNELHTLQIKLQKMLENKMFLLVLDDIWNEDPIRCDTLKIPLLGGGTGSRILITTRNKNVATVMDPKLALHLNGLKARDSWDLFRQFAFKGRSVQDVPSSLVTTGHNIVEKSNGVPLVIRLLGSVLSPDTSEESWDDVLKSDLWELDEGKKFIFPVLKISYQHLPSPIKPCFAHCASFPKGYKFNKDDLVRIWDALGFLPSNRKNDSVAIGISFVDDLISRSFFQIDQEGTTETLIMHDLIHDLACLIAGNECLTLAENDMNDSNNDTSNIMFGMFQSDCHTFKKCDISDIIFSKHLRHLYGIPLAPINEHFALRSFHAGGGFLLGFGNLTGLIESKSLRYLKVLHVSFNSPPYIHEIIKYCKHLRYVSFSGINFIPESISLLYNLQTLQIKDSRDIQLPMGLRRLINLKHLIISMHAIKSMPIGIFLLRNLQILSCFAVSSNKRGASLAELKELNNLKGTLQITQLHYITGDRITEAKEACLCKKEQLLHLSLHWGMSPFTSRQKMVIPHDELVLSYLRPHIGIETIYINDYRNPRFPEWLNDRKFSKISKLTLASCHYCEQLPALGELPCLKNLKIYHMPELKRIGSEFYGSSNVPFPLLETLQFEFMPGWEEWWTVEGDANLYPSLVELELMHCWKLKPFSVINMPSLETVSIRECPELLIEGRESHPRLQVKRWIQYDWFFV